MKIAVSTKDFATVCGHAGQARRWLLFDLSELESVRDLPAPVQIELEKEKVIHHFDDKGPHPLDDIAAVITFSAGDGFIRRMEARGAQVIMTGETDPAAAIRTFLIGGRQPEPPFDITTKFCKIHDFFSKHRA